MNSNSYSLDKKDWISWLKNVVVFFIPVISYILVQLQSGQSIQWVVIETTIIGLVLNLIKKWEQGLPTSPTDGTPTATA